MEKTEIKKMKEAINDVLKAGKKFNDVFKKTYSSGVIGELLVTQRLLDTYGKDFCSKDNCNIKFEGNCIQNFDIILVLDGIEFKINAKATRVQEKGYPKWVRQSAKKFVEYKQNKNLYYDITQKKKYDDNLFYIYVNVKKWLDSEKTDFYVLSDEDVTKSGNIKGFIKCHSGKKKKIYTDMWVEYKHIRQFKDNKLERFSKEVKQ